VKTSWTIPRLIEELTRGLASGEYSSEGLAVDLRGRPVVGCEAGVDGAAALVIEWPESEEEAARTMQREWQRHREVLKRLAEACGGMYTEKAPAKSGLEAALELQATAARIVETWIAHEEDESRRARRAQEQLDSVEEATDGRDDPRDPEEA
jgi:hypothetical protein